VDKLLEISGVVDCRFLASIWATNNLAGVVISNLQFYINPLNYNKTKCNKKPLSE